MLISEVAKLSPFDRFVYWISERHKIYLRRQAGKSKPWTDDTILQRGYFTNPYRENDRTTKWLRDNIREPLRNDLKVIFAVVCFRWFNKIETGEILLKNGLFTKWNQQRAFEVLDAVRQSGVPIFTGAYKINSPAGEGKLEAILNRCTLVWNDNDRLCKLFERKEGITIERAHSEFTRYNGLGGFMSYEIVCDLRYTKYLENAPDKLTWCNPGPGCIRGLLRLEDKPFLKGNNERTLPKPKDWQSHMIRLLADVRKRLSKLPTFEMREIEHSLCEWDKYERVLQKDGKLRRNYQGF